MEREAWQSSWSLTLGAVECEDAAYILVDQKMDWPGRNWGHVITQKTQLRDQLSSVKGSTASPDSATKWGESLWRCVCFTFKP